MLALVAGLMLALLLASCDISSTPPGFSPSLPPPSPIDSTPPPADAPLLGVNRSGLEYYCTQYSGFIDGPTDQASVSAMLAWKINTVRLPLNEDCWLGINGVKPQWSGANYRDFVAKYVNLLNANGIRVVLDLHHAAPGTHLAIGQAPMPDADHSIDFWISLATLYANRPLVYFDVFNEIYNASASCYLSGCTFTAADYGAYVPNYGTYKAVGVQQLINTVRATGANNLILVPGNQWGNDMSAFARLTDPAHNLMGDFHVYNGYGKTPQQYFDKFAAYQAATSYPLVAGEIGEYDCQSSFVNPIYDYADSHHIGYLAWTWDAWAGKCATGPALISDWSGAPTPYGVGLQAHLKALAGSGKFA